MNQLHRYSNFVVVMFICLLAPISNCYDKELTINIEAGKQDCFFQHANIGEIIDVEYQVIDGGHGDLDINFELAEPTGRILSHDYKKSDNIIRHDVKMEGDYRICFDNRFSTFNRKTVFFELIVENENDDSSDTENSSKWKEVLGGVTAEEFYDLKVQDIQDYVARIRSQLTKARQIQDMIRSYEARDRNIAEENYLKVNIWSMFQICAMMAVGSLQVFMVRSIFDTNSKMYTMWKKLNL